MTQSARDLENTFAHAWELLSRNWILVVPGLVLALIGAGLEFLLTVVALGSYVITGNGSADAAAAAQAFMTVAVFIVSMAVSIVQMAYVTGMAGAAWQHGRTGLGDGWKALSHRLLAIVAAALLLLLVGFCAAVLSTVTFLVPLGIYAVFFIYTLASVIIGGRGSVDGIGESCRLALSNFLPTLAVVALIVLIAVGGAWLGSLVGRFWEFGGWLVAGLLQQVIVAYASLVVAGEYLKLTKQPTV